MAEKIQSAELLIVYPNCIDGVDFRNPDGSRTEKNYGMTFAIDSDNPFIEKLRESLIAALIEKFQLKPDSKEMEKALDNNFPLVAVEDHDTLSTVPRLKGMTLIRTKAKQPVHPVHIDDLETLIEDQEQITTGDFGVAVLNPFAYTFGGKKGVSLYLSAFCKTGNGPTFKVGNQDFNKLFKGIDKSALTMSAKAKEEVSDEIKNLM